MRGIFPAAALALAFLMFGSAAQARGHSDLSREFTSEGRYSGGAPAFEGRTVYRSKKRKLNRSVKRTRVTRTLATEPRTIGGYAEHLSRHPTRDLSGFPSPLVAKVREIESACGARVISAYRPGARVRGSGRMSLHASRRAVDMSGNPSCIYARLRSWPGGVSSDYGRVRHVHFSYSPNGAEWGARFAHYGGRKFRRHRYAIAQ